MTDKRLNRQFYTRSTLVVSKDLLGRYLVRKIGQKILVGKIVETEAYVGVQDKASHAFSNNKKDISREKFDLLYEGMNVDTNRIYRNFLKHGGKITPRNKTEYLEGGYIYIYLCYGMHWQLNITTAKAGQPECILIRALEPVIDGKDIKNLSNGPGKLCNWMKLDKSFDGGDLTESKRIWLEVGERANRKNIIASKRIGIDYAGAWKNKLWRFYLKDNQFVSKTG